MDCEKIEFEGWEQPLKFDELDSVTFYEDLRLQLTYERNDEIDSLWIHVDGFGSNMDELLSTLGSYKDRYAKAVEHQKHR